MRELDCDFCGDRAAGAYEVIPAELDPTPEEQVRVVLCESCRNTLDAVSAPLLARLGVGDGGVDRQSNGSASATSRPPSAAKGDSESDAPEDGAQASARSANTISPADDAVIIDSGQRRSRRATDESDGASDNATTDTVREFVKEAEAGAEEPDADKTDEDDETENADAEEADDGAADAESSSEEEEETVRERAGEPEHFRTVMRLLNNREFPVDRVEITDLASGAYELQVSEVEAIIDHAVEREFLAEEKGKLTKG